MVDAKSSRYHSREEDRSEYQKAHVCSADEEGELELSSRGLFPSLPVAVSDILFICKMGGHLTEMCVFLISLIVSKFIEMNVSKTL